ncbi:MAG: phosphoenolpyruvate carboxykinase (ATP) [Alphaproteobacteria bacterium]|nr:phosphoenolpyruvate carboxykinase (ATP) [Alphaproteobacteria bacterium]
MQDLHDPASIAATILESANPANTDQVTAALFGAAICRREAKRAGGALIVRTGKFTGRSANDKFIVRDATTADLVWWENTGAMAPHQFETLLTDMMVALRDREIFHQRLFAGAHSASRLGVEMFSTSAWHALFIRHLLIKPSICELDGFETDVTIVHVPDFEAQPGRHGTKTTTCIALDFSRNIILICGTAYAGEIKKAVFSLFNFHAPANNILPMHCSANVGPKGDTTLFFGLSGTGKTTLSTCADRALVGDDEHGWGPDGIFNIEGGCYAKAINLDPKGEPEIFAASRRFGTVLENVVLDPATGKPDFSNQSLTENTRIAYPLAAIPNRVKSGLVASPRNIVLLAADAFGVLPPISRLDPEQAVYYFLSGYTAKLAGTERGVTEPQATFSACFGAPFMAQHPSVYGQLLAERLKSADVACWLVNTGWTGGPYGVGKRMDLALTRRVLEAALGGELEDVTCRTDPVFALQVPTAITGVDPAILDPVQTWSDKTAFAKQARALKALFEQKFERLGPGVGRFALPQPEDFSAAKSDAA